MFRRLPRIFVWVLLLGCDAGADVGNRPDGGFDAGPRGLRVFVTSTRYPADLGGPEGADALCALAARAAELGGTWRAWISTPGPNGRNAVDAIEGRGPWWFTDEFGRTIVVFNNRDHLRTQPLSPIDHDEFGRRECFPGESEPVWTGTDTGGVARVSDSSCDHWTRSEGMDTARMGNACSAVAWTSSSDRSCSSRGRLYCFEVEPTVVSRDAGTSDAGGRDAGPGGLDAGGQDAGRRDSGRPDGGPRECVPVAGAKRVFVTSVAFDGNLRLHGGGSNGIVGADNLCHTVATRAGLEGTWTAWLSSDERDAIDRLPADGGPWYLVDRCTMVFANRFAVGFENPMSAIRLTERGDRVTESAWTGTDENGRADPWNCDNWTDGEEFGGHQGRVGFNWETRDLWTAGSTHTCHFENALYCFER